MFKDVLPLIIDNGHAILIGKLFKAVVINLNHLPISIPNFQERLFETAAKSSQINPMISNSKPDYSKFYPSLLANYFVRRKRIIIVF